MGCALKTTLMAAKHVDFSSSSLRPGKILRISIRNNDGSFTEHYCHSEAPGYNKLKQLLAQAK